MHIVLQQLCEPKQNNFYVVILSSLFACSILATITGSSETSRVTDILTVDGRRVLLEDLTVKDCAKGHFSCIWADSFETPVFVENRTKGWIYRPEEWKASSMHGPYEIADGINYATEILESGLSSRREWMINAVDEGRLDIPIPLFILSDPEQMDKRENSLHLLRSTGFSGNISFLPFTPASTIDIGQLIMDEVIDEAAIDRMLTSGWIGKRALNSYIANAIDHLGAVKSGADSGFELFGIFEDDLMLSGSPDTIRMRIMHALQMSPPTADMLYLEACHEYCSERKFSYRYPLWARTSGPSCNAAIIFTKKGARRISLLARSIFWGSDNMYASMIRDGLLEAYIITPTVFLQDGFWRSSLQALRGSRVRRKIGDRSVPGVTHRPFSLMCKELDNEFRLVHVQISEETEFLRQCFASAYLVSSPGKAILLSDFLSDNPAKDHDDAHIAYFTKDYQDSWLQVGHWPQEYGAHGVVLWIDNRSVCFESVEKGECVLKVQLSELAEDKITHVEKVMYVEVSDLLFVHHRVDEQSDILLISFRNTRESCILQQPGTETNSGAQSLGERHLNHRTQQIRQSTSSEPFNEGSNTEMCEVQKKSLLTGVHFIFDGVMFMWYSGKMSGVNKMWYNIVPFMADIVHALNGTFTHCQSSWLSDERELVKDIPRVENLFGCDNLTQVVQDLPGDKKIVFSSYYRIAELQGDNRVCNILPLYDFIPERMGVYNQQHPAFYLKTAHIPLVSGFLSLSNSTTSDLQELHGIDSAFVSTSPNRAAKIFNRVEPIAQVMFDDDFVGSDELQTFLNSAKRYLLLIGHSKHSPAYKGYDIFWAALSDMPAEFKANFSLVIIGGLPKHNVETPDIVCVPDVPEHVLPILYSRASALVYPSRYEGFGMPPIEAITCGCPVILGSFYEDKMQYVYGSDALYGGNVKQMQASLLKVYEGDVPSPEKLIARARMYGGDPKHGWNEVAKHYMEYIMSGPFMETEFSRCEELLSPACKRELQIEVTDDGLIVV